MCWKKRNFVETGAGGNPVEAVELDNLETQLVINGNNENNNSDPVLDGPNATTNNDKQNQTFRKTMKHRINHVWNTTKNSKLPRKAVKGVAKVFVSEEYACRWKFCVGTTCFSCFLFLIILLPIIFYVVIPTTAAQMMGAATMDIINGTLSNPTCNSIDMSSFVKIQNTGMFGAKIYSSKVNILRNGIKIGYMTLPTMTITGNPPNIVQMTTTLHITNNTQFKLSIKDLMNEKDQYWLMSSINNQKIDAYIFGFTLTTHAKFSKKMVLTGSEFIGAKTSNMKVDGLVNDNSDKLATTSDTTFFSTSKFFVKLPVNTKMDFYYNNQYVGYTLLQNGSNELKPGWNKLVGTQAVIDRNDENEDTVKDFFDGYMTGDTQYLHLRGPVPNHLDDDPHELSPDCENLVINNIVDIEIEISGSGGIGDLLEQLTTDTLRFFIAGLNPFD